MANAGAVHSSSLAFAPSHHGFLPAPRTQSSLLRRSRCAGSPTRRCRIPVHARASLHQSDGLSRAASTFDGDGRRAVAFMCVASEFRLGPLYRRLLRCGKELGIKASATGSILHLFNRVSGREVDAFVFAYGSVVVWGASSVEAFDLAALITEDAVGIRPYPAVEWMEFEYGKSGGPRRDTILLEAPLSDMVSSAEDSAGAGEARDPVLEKLAISCALAQSIKLSVFESAMRETIDLTKHLPEELAARGRISASRREISRTMGRLFLDRYRFHLSGDLLMTPAFFWENEKYLVCYRRTERYLEIRERGEILNKRVEVVSQLFELLGDELSHQSSVALELAITLMIAFEIVLTLISIAKESVRTMVSSVMLFACLFGILCAVWVLVMRRRRSRISARQLSTLNSP